MHVKYTSLEGYSATSIVAYTVHVPELTGFSLYTSGHSNISDIAVKACQRYGAGVWKLLYGAMLPN